MSRPTFEQAKARYTLRFTMEHVPEWAQLTTGFPDGGYSAPQYRTDREWFDNTTFPGERGHINSRNYCYSTNQSWPLGQRLDQPYRKEDRVHA